MRKIFAFVFSFFITSHLLQAQNVGIGTTTPTEKLDVNGNLNLSGNIKINNTAGENGQVLRTNSSGNMEWAKIGDYQNFQSFSSLNTTIIWPVPAGITKILVEVWGGGGGGAEGGGGGGGGYVMAQYTITTPMGVTMFIGAGGGAPLTADGDGYQGGTTTATIGTIQQISSGGFGATAFRAGYPSGPGFVVNPAIQQLGIAGEEGYRTTENYGQFSSTMFYTAIQFGNGGNSPFAPTSGGAGAFRSFNTATSTLIKTYQGGYGRCPGGGGGGGGGVGSTASYFGREGGKGMVIIRW